MVVSNFSESLVAHSLSRKVWLRKAWVVAVAYAFAIQLLLGSLVATQMAFSRSLDAAAICHTDSSDSSGHPDRPGHLNHLALCSICVFASISPPLPAAAGQPAVAVLLGRAAKPQHIARLFTRESFDPRSSQGPPQIS
jgi:hypothetical protein